MTDMRYKALVALGCLLLASLIFTASTEAQVSQPALPSFSIDSDNATSSGTNEIAITGDTATLSFSANETIQTTTVVFTVDGVSAAGPVTVSSLTTYDWSSISLGWYHTVALKSDGTLWAWGSNEYGGQLDGGTTANNTTPTQEWSGATDWSAIAGGGQHTVALK